MPKGCFGVLSHTLKVDLVNRFSSLLSTWKATDFHSCCNRHYFMMDLLETVKHFIEKESYKRVGGNL